MPCYEFEDRVVWGLTLRMVDELLELRGSRGRVMVARAGAVRQPAASSSGTLNGAPGTSRTSRGTR